MGLDWVIIGLSLGVASLFGLISGRIGGLIGVRGVRIRLGSVEQELEMLGARQLKLANARKSDLATESRVDGKQGELVKILSEALANRTAGTNLGVVPQAYPPEVMGR